MGFEVTLRMRREICRTPSRDMGALHGTSAAAALRSITATTTEVSAVRIRSNENKISYRRNAARLLRGGSVGEQEA
jgi:hypothetical protein